MKTVVAQQWMESERGWGTRPDGVTLHPDRAHRDAWVQQNIAGRSDVVPDEYSYADGKPVEIEVDDETYAEVIEKAAAGKVMWAHSISPVLLARVVPGQAASQTKAEWRVNHQRPSRRHAWTNSVAKLLGCHDRGELTMGELHALLWQMLTPERAEELCGLLPASTRRSFERATATLRSGDVTISSATNVPVPEDAIRVGETWRREGRARFTDEDLIAMLPGSTQLDPSGERMVQILIEEIVESRQAIRSLRRQLRAVLGSSERISAQAYDVLRTTPQCPAGFVWCDTCDGDETGPRCPRCGGLGRLPIYEKDGGK